METLAVSSWVAAIYVAVAFAIVVVPMVVTLLKGHWLLFAAGWMTLGLVWWIAALRLARPRSWWSRRFYDPDELARSQSRYGASD